MSWCTERKIIPELLGYIESKEGKKIAGFYFEIKAAGGSYTEK